MMVVATPNGRRRRRTTTDWPNSYKCENCHKKQSCSSVQTNNPINITQHFSYLHHHKLFSRYTFDDTESIITQTLHPSWRGRKTNDNMSYHDHWFSMWRTPTNLHSPFPSLPQSHIMQYKTVSPAAIVTLLHNKKMITAKTTVLNLSNHYP